MSKHRIGYLIFGLFSMAYAYGVLYLEWTPAYYLPFLVIWILIIVYGSFTISSNYHLKAISKVQTQEKVVAITFDDGPSECTSQVLALLDKYAIKASFFCIGKQVEKHPEELKAIYKAGHTIGNHTFSHSKVGFRSMRSMLREIKATDKAIEKIVGVKPVYFRPPFGVTNPNMMRALRISKHTVIGWNIRSIDTAIKGKEKVLKRIETRLQPGSIILLHDTSQHSVAILEQLLLYLQNENYKSVSIDALLKLEK